MTPCSTADHINYISTVGALFAETQNVGAGIIHQARAVSAVLAQVQRKLLSRRHLDHLAQARHVLALRRRQREVKRPQLPHIDDRVVAGWACSSFRKCSLRRNYHERHW